MKYLIHFIIFLNLFGFTACKSTKQQTQWSEIEKVFVEAHDTIQTSVYWYWISDHLSKEGVVNDLKAMKSVGINRAFIGNIGLNDLPGNPYGKVKIFSDEWWDVLHTALKTASELNIEIGIFNSPGWSQSGGPWVKSQQAMRYLSSRDTLVKGPFRYTQNLKLNNDPFQDVQIIAFQVGDDYFKTLADLKPKLTASAGIQNAERLLDNNKATETKIPVGKTATFSVQTDDAFTVRSLTVYPAERSMRFRVNLEVKNGNAYEQIKSFEVNRNNPALNVGFEPFAPVVVNIPNVKSNQFRIAVQPLDGDVGITELELSSTAKVERYKEKTLAKMHPTPLPYWGDYLWDRQTESDLSDGSINPSSVQLLDSFISKDSLLTWDVPEGNWVISRTGMLPTGTTNGPASIEGTGLEIDKMSSQHVAYHFDSFLGEIMKRIPKEDRKTFKVAVQDSYETGGQNWTDEFQKKFQKSFGYDPAPYIPVLFGHVVGSQDFSDRFLWDVRRFVADNVAYEYVGGLRDISHKHGLTIWLENYGHWGFPGEFLQYGGQSDEIGGEFWSEGELGDIENRAASSAAHIYGKRKVSAESFTAAGNTFGRYPAMFKQRGDRFFTEGINNTLLHVYIHQPYEDKKPGINAWFGNEFNRFNTWFADMGMFTDYLKRSNYLLQQGTYVADVAYFIGEDVPKMTGVQNPKLPQGYSFDYINAEVIQNRMTIKDGRFTLPDGLSYKVLVLPELETMRPELLKKIAQLVKEGGIVLGPKPLRSPSLTNGEEADKEIKKLADELWGKIDVKSITKNDFGKGQVFSGVSLEILFAELGTNPDFIAKGADQIQFLHRNFPDADVYFISNQKNEKAKFIGSFRGMKLQPELWNAVNGKVSDLPEFTVSDATLEIPLELNAFESAFIVFKKPITTQAKSDVKNFPSPKLSVPVEDSWKVVFKNIDSTSFEKANFQLIDWSKSSDDKIKYFSGTAIYSKTIKMNDVSKGQKVYLDLGHLIAIAKIKLNGQDIGGLWTPPYKIDVTEFWKSGDNQLEIEVTNTWVNKLIGEARLPESQRSSWTIVNPYTKDSALHSAGLHGPVIIEVYE
ncbi:glycosyl hydrolase [Sphingobacterium hungaricum]|uniref:Glycoside hydrolase family 2 n=1 Tax=Sphingobacterium hungaricum TaxID=2082723 RepID=A0A928UYG5_9SPHI|nr:glycosyl hydrolase [Sphingobacterium hungaricum]MBE8713721.1 glycoside hydrolase family 2 [Sphingobacterium hungaricum]